MPAKRETVQDRQKRAERIASDVSVWMKGRKSGLPDKDAVTAKAKKFGAEGKVLEMVQSKIGQEMHDLRKAPQGARRNTSETDRRITQMVGKIEEFKGGRSPSFSGPQAAGVLVDMGGGGQTPKGSRSSRSSGSGPANFKEAVAAAKAVGKSTPVARKAAAEFFSPTASSASDEVALPKGTVMGRTASRALSAMGSVIGLGGGSDSGDTAASRRTTGSRAQPAATRKISAADTIRRRTTSNAPTRPTGNALPIVPEAAVVPVPGALPAVRTTRSGTGTNAALHLFDETLLPRGTPPGSSVGGEDPFGSGDPFAGGTPASSNGSAGSQVFLPAAERSWGGPRTGLLLHEMLALEARRRRGRRARASGKAKAKPKGRKAAKRARK